MGSIGVDYMRVLDPNEREVNTNLWILYRTFSSERERIIEGDLGVYKSNSTKGCSVTYSWL